MLYRDFIDNVPYIPLIPIKEDDDTNSTIQYQWTQFYLHHLPDYNYFLLKSQDRVKRINNNTGPHIETEEAEHNVEEKRNAHIITLHHGIS